MVSLFELVALAALSQAAIITETEYATQWTTVYANGHVHTEAPSPVISLPEPSSSEAVGFTTTVTLPLLSGEKTVVLTYDPVSGYEIPTDLFDAPPPPTATSTTESHSYNFQYIDSSSEAPAPTPSSVAPPAPKVKTSSTAPAPAATTSSSSSDSGLSGLAKECVDYHNKVRAQHQAGPVTWDDKLAGFAEKYLDGNCKFAHSGGPYGENIAMGYGSATAAMQAWYDENQYYDYSAGQFGEKTGHFTQMVWKATQKIGCAQTSCGSSGYFLACEYADSRGNVIGYFTENVFPSA